MPEITLISEITEYACMTAKKYEYVSFSPNKKSVVISLLNVKEKVLLQTEVAVEDILKLAEIIKISKT